jgi:E3 ubiquitin-protein ligase RNF144
MPGKMLRLRLRFSKRSSSRNLPGSSVVVEPPPPPAPVELVACPVCFRDDVPPDEAVRPGACNHVACKACITEYLKAAAADRRYPVKCISCDDALPGQACVDVLDGEPKAVMEVLMLEREHHGVRVRFCCNTRCSTPFDYVEPEPAVAATEFGGRVTCPLCGMAQCARCNVPIHPGRSCRDVQAGAAAGSALDGDGKEAVAILAVAEGWKKCPGCETYTSKDMGCNYCVCKCGIAFCFQCRMPYVSSNRHLPGANVHGIPGCKCGLYNS